MLGPSDGTFAVTSGFIPLANLQRQISKDPTNSATADYTETLWTPSGVDLLLIGTGEYMTGYTDSSLPHSKSCVGVVALTMFDLRRRNKINRLGLCGKDGRSFPHIRLHLQKTISDVYSGLSTEVETFPADDETKQFAYADALLRYGADDAVIVHSSYGSSQYQIALDAIEKKMHVLLMLPTSQTLEQQIVLLNAARRNNVLVVFECCYRFDAMCIDARDRIHKLGSFSYMYSHITQPKFSKSMDCEVSLGDGNDCILFPNSNYVDFHTWVSGNSSRPISVTACASNSISTQSCNLECEESVTLMVQWENLDKVCIAIFCDWYPLKKISRAKGQLFILQLGLLLAVIASSISFTCAGYVITYVSIVVEMSSICIRLAKSMLINNKVDIPQLKKKRVSKTSILFLRSLLQPTGSLVAEIHLCTGTVL